MVNPDRTSLAGPGSAAPVPRMNSTRTPSPAVDPASPPPACPGTTRAGRPCRATPTSDGWCPNHSPKFTAELRSSWGRRGALSNLKRRTVDQLVAAAAGLPEAAPQALVPASGRPSFATAESVREYLESCAAKVEANRLAPSCAGAIAQFAALALKLVEVQLDARLLEHEIEQAEKAEARPAIRFGS